MDDENADTMANVSSPLDIGLYIIVFVIYERFYVVCSAKNVNVGYLNGERLLSFFSSKKIVLEKLDGLRDDKAAGADDLVPRFLNSIKQELVSK